MKLKAITEREAYETPAIIGIDVISEGVLCSSGQEGSIEDYDRVGDVDGWGI
jgi:hypothetical protein